MKADIIQGVGLVNILLGSAYLYTGVILAFLTRLLVKANSAKYPFMLAKKTNLVSFMYLVAVTMGTVAYQNFFSDFGAHILWWRFFLIASMAGLLTNWYNYCKKITKELAYV